MRERARVRRAGAGEGAGADCGNRTEAGDAACEGAETVRMVAMSIGGALLRRTGIAMLTDAGFEGASALEALPAFVARPIAKKQPNTTQVNPTTTISARGSMRGRPLSARFQR